MQRMKHLMITAAEMAHGPTMAMALPRGEMSGMMGTPTTDPMNGAMALPASDTTMGMSTASATAGLVHAPHADTGFAEAKEQHVVAKTNKVELQIDDGVLASDADVDIQDSRVG